MAETGVTYENEMLRALGAQVQQLANLNGAAEVQNSQLAQLANATIAQSQRLDVSGISGTIRSYDGSPNKFKEWIQAVEIYGAVSQLDDARLSLIALLSSEGQAREIIAEKYTANPALKWSELKPLLVENFAEITSPEHALSLLQAATQEKNEKIETFNLRLRELARYAFPGEDIENNPLINKHLVGQFVKGIRTQKTREKLLRVRPTLLTEAVKIAKRELDFVQLLSLHSNTQREVQPMEVDHFRPQGRCYNCDKIGHKAKDCRKERRAHARPHRVEAVNKNGYRKFGDQSRVLECWHCGGPHIRAKCPQLRENRQNPMPPQEN